MITAARSFAFALSTALTFGTLSAAEPLRIPGGSDASSTVTLSARGNSAVLEHELTRQMDRYVVYPVMTRDKDL
ncbi:MAG TPA: hypothetical protein VHL57_05270, partial [Flavobacteriales bacterium]|nr:hypothetical protein [Flavobacteriales bacterium]